MKELAKRLQKSIDTLVQDNIFRLKLISKRASSVKSSKFLKSGKKKTKGKEGNKRRLSTTSDPNVEFKPVQGIDRAMGA